MTGLNSPSGPIADSDSFTYDAASRMLTAASGRYDNTVAVDSTTIDTRVYDDGGRMTSSSYNNGVSEARSYNADNTVAGISYSTIGILPVIFRTRQRCDYCFIIRTKPRR